MPDLLEESFDFLAQLDDGWSAAADCHGISVTTKNKTPTSYYVQGRLDLPYSLEQSVCLFRPEALFHQDSGLQSDAFSEVVIPKHFSPGDILASVKFSSWWKELLTSEIRTGRHCGDPEVNTRVLRVCMRRGWPRLGCVSVVTLPLYVHESYKPDVFTMMGIVLSADDEDDPEATSTSLQIVFDMPRYEKIQEMFFERCSNLACCWGLNPNFEQLAQKYSYMVLAMRKCCRGPPLVPEAHPGSEPPSAIDDAWLHTLSWRSSEEGMPFHLTTHLKHLLKLCGEETDIVYDRLDGHELMSYQVVVRRCIWPRIWPLLQPILKKHQSVYRHVRGGTAAPFLQADVEPRFVMRSVSKSCGSLKMCKVDSSTSASTVSASNAAIVPPMFTNLAREKQQHELCSLRVHV